MTEIKLTKFRSPETLIARFVFRGSMRSAAIWAVVIAAYVASKAIGFGKLYPTPAVREKLASTLGNNPGINALIGTPHNVQTVPGYTAWNAIGVIVIVLSLWAIFLTTKTLRGAEDTGRWEILIAGQTTARRALVNALVGLYGVIAFMYVIVAAGFIYIGKNHYVGYGTSQALYFALCSVLAAAIFVAIASLTSQLMPARSRATGLAAITFGIFFLVRAAADSTSLHWLNNITPLGWIEKLGALTTAAPIWLIPIAALIFITLGLSIYIAAKRDLESAIFSDKDSAKPKTKLLSGVFPSVVKLNYLNTIGWVSAVALMGLFYGVITKSAAKVLAQSSSATKAFNKIIQINTHSLAKLYLGIAFLIYMLLIMGFAAYTSSKLREEEGSGLLDNFLVRPVSRWKYLSKHSVYVVLVLVLLAFTGGIFTYIGVVAENASIGFHDILLASINSIVPAIFTLGLGVFALGFLPRFTSVLAYGIIGWSFLIDMLNSGLKLNHYILDTSIFTHMALSPAVGVKWKTNLIIIVIAAVLFLAGMAKFNSRDLVNE